MVVVTSLTVTYQIQDLRTIGCPNPTTTFTRTVVRMRRFRQNALDALVPSWPILA